MEQLNNFSYFEKLDIFRAISNPLNQTVVVPLITAIETKHTI